MSKFDDMIVALNAALTQFDSTSPEDLPDIIASIYDVLTNLPPAQQQLFEPISDEQMDVHVQSRASAAVAGSLIVRSSGSPSQVIADAVILLRAAEQTLAQFGRYIEGDKEGNLEDAWQTKDGRHYVIPHVRAIRAKLGKTLKRRALHLFRVLPAREGDRNIRLYRGKIPYNAETRMRLKAGKPINYGAAFFPKLQLEVLETASDFTVTGLNGYDAESLISSQVLQGRKEQCSAIIWGELTMRQKDVTFLATQLRDNFLSEGTSPQFVAAGSWHIKTGDETRNIATVLDGAGRPLLTYAKYMKYEWRGLYEAIVPGTEIPVLISEDQMFTMSICRDFLDETTEPPFRKLHVDIALVSSMAPSHPDNQTMINHAVTANVMKVRYGTRALVVQQLPAPEKGMVGQVLSFPDKPVDPSAILSVNDAFLTCPCV